MRTALHDGCKAADNHRHGLTLVELLVVMAIIALVVAILLPALSGAKANTKQIACMNNLRQFEVAFQLYASDNAGKLSQNVSMTQQGAPTNSWVYGDMKKEEDATNSILIKNGELCPYVLQTAVYHCPADVIVDNGLPRLRSYAMNSWIGSQQMESQQQQNPYRIFMKDSDLAAGKPSSIWVVMDESTVTLDDGWFEVTMNDSEPFIALPASRHQNAYALNFADGHAEIYRLRTAVAQIPETQFSANAGGTYKEVPANNIDWLKLKQVTTSE